MSRIEVILGCRLVLNLRQLSSDSLESQHDSGMPNIRFATSTLLANIGAPLRIGEEEDEIGDADEEVENRRNDVVVQENSVQMITV